MTQQHALSRRRFVQTSSLALASIGFGRASRAQSPKPNIVFVMADDLGYADVSCYGQRDYTTPNVDRLAMEGLRFTQGYANSAVCSATRTALATGRYRLAAKLPDPAVAAEEGGLQHGVGGQMASRLSAGLQSVEVYDQFFGIFGGAADYFTHGADALRTGAESSQLHEQEVPIERHGYMTNLLGDRAVQTVEGFAKSFA